MKKTIALCFLLLVSACSSPLHTQNMIIPTNAVKLSQGSLNKTVYVDMVSGGQKIHPLLKFKLENEDFKKALSLSLKRFNLFAEDKAQAQYVLTSEIIDFDIPAVSNDAKVTSIVKYTLTNQQGIKKEFLINAYYVEEASSIFSRSTERPRIGAEGSIKENIKKFIIELDKLVI